MRETRFHISVTTDNLRNFLAKPSKDLESEEIESKTHNTINLHTLEITMNPKICYEVIYGSRFFRRKVQENLNGIILEI